MGRWDGVAGAGKWPREAVKATMARVLVVSTISISSTAFIECKDLQPSLTVVVAQCASASRTPPPSRLPASIVQPPPSIFRGHSTSAAVYYL